MFENKINNIAKGIGMPFTVLQILRYEPLVIITSKYILPAFQSRREDTDLYQYRLY